MSLETLNLTKNQQTVLDILESASEPLKAYTILFDIQKKGIKSPLQVYRALDKLIEIGKVHKIESRIHMLLVSMKAVMQKLLHLF